uniref:Aminotransferase class I/classII large domain-containing protein n=1 Tax=Monodelphis domestica TaxID=13616 RepID=A0A5F8GJ39_MONDO
LFLLPQQGSGASLGPAAPTPLTGFGLAFEDQRGARIPQRPEQTFPGSYKLWNPGTNHPQRSPYLSTRGNDINSKRGFSQEGFANYAANKYDEEKNPSGIINLGVSENKLCFDLLSNRVSIALGFPFFLSRSASKLFRSVPLIWVERMLRVARLGVDDVFSPPASEAFLIPTPFYGGISDDVYYYGNVQLVYAHLDSKVRTGTNTRPFQLTVEKLEMALWKARREGVSVRGLILINPHNPLGDIYSPAELLEYLEFAKRYQLHVIMDELYMLTVFDESVTFHSVLSIDKLPDPQRTHVVWGTSKDFGISGIRFGALYTENKDVSSAVTNLCYFHGISGITQYQMAQLLSDHDWIDQVYLPTNRLRLKAAHTYVTDELKTLGIPFLNRNSGLYVWIDLRKYLRRGTFEEELLLWCRFLRHKVLLSNGKSFQCFEPGWFRIIFTDKMHRLQLGEQGQLLSPFVT